MKKFKVIEGNRLLNPERILAGGGIGNIGTLCLQEIMLFFANILTERAIRDRPIIRQNPVMEVALTIHVVCGPHMM